MSRISLSTSWVRFLHELKARVITADKHSWRSLGSNIEDRRSANRTRQVVDAESGTCFNFLNIGVGAIHL